MIVDPVEETFPFQGQAVLHDLEDGLSLADRRCRRPGAMPIASGSSSIGPSSQELARRRGWTLTIHRTDRPASEAALRLMTLVSASRGTHWEGVERCSAFPSPSPFRSS